MSLPNLQAPRRKMKLGEFLISKGIITEAQLEEALNYQKSQGVFLGEALVSLGFVSSSTLGSYMEQLTTFPYVDLSTFPVNALLAQGLSEQFCRLNLVLPFAEWDDAVQVAMVDPLNLGLADTIRTKLGKRISPYLAFRTEILDAIGRVYDIQHKGQVALAELKIETEEDDLTEDMLESMADDAPIVRLVNGIIESAVSSKASDIHIEPQEKMVRVRFRQDGVLIEQMTFPRSHLSATISRLKVMSNLNIAERRRPQDGRISIRDDKGMDFDLRVSILPLVHGESVVMRVLDKSMTSRKLSDLGMNPELSTVYNHLIRQPHGIILVTGPTGSGKTTTLYATLMAINDVDKKIMTVEDPVEYQLSGINQVQVLTKIGLTFAEALRSIVRQDPDVILVGEIRDRETAEIAIQAALTGHLVLSTLHTNDAPSALIRLQNMGIEPFLLSSSLLGVLAQRLLRNICPHCKEVSSASPAMIEKFSLPMIDGRAPMLAQGQGCMRCNNKGMRGRAAVYEFMPMSEKLRELTLKGAAANVLKQQAIAEGMLTMRNAGLMKVTAGQTTLEEVARVLFTEDDGTEDQDNTRYLIAA